MAKRNRNTDPNGKGKGSKKGRGIGRGQDYDPHLHIQDVPSRGRVSRCRGWHTGRMHHLMSKLEQRFFYILEWSQIVSDIREQFPLDIEETLAIAQSLDIKHPVYRGTKQPIVLTTDFLITIRTPFGFIDHARTIKYTNELSSIRVMQKYEIERVYWERRNIDWGIVTERDINLIVATNTEIIHYYRDPSTLSPLTDDIVHQIETILTRRVVKEGHPLKIITNDCDDQLGLPPGSSTKVVLHLLANRRWQVDMSVPLEMSNHIFLLNPPRIMVQREGGNANENRS